MKTIKKLLTIAPLLLSAYAGSAHALVINFIPTAGMSSSAIDAFHIAGQRWSSVLQDDVQVNLNINFAILGERILGQTSSATGFVPYAAARDALRADATSAFDQQAVAHLPTGNCLSVLMNGTTSNPNGPGSPTPFIDNDCNNNNRFLSMNSANARALGLLSANNPLIDGSVAFSSAFMWDFDPSNGITAGAHDFVGVATHEIGHALGFTSGVDILEQARGANVTSAQLPYITPMDLFRCTPVSKARGADLDWSADARTKYFSLDNCSTALAMFSSGRRFGDGEQASHWLDNMNFGLMDPTAPAPGTGMNLTDLDVLMFDVIGWDVQVAAVPEPGSVALFLLGLAALGGMRRRRQAGQ